MNNFYIFGAKVQLLIHIRESISIYFFTIYLSDYITLIMSVLDTF